MKTRIRIRSTTVLAVRRDGKVVIAGDGQVTMGQTVVKATARKIRRLADGRVIAGFAGSAADGITLFEKFEGKLKEGSGNLMRERSSWPGLAHRSALRRLEALLIVADRERTFILSGTGDVIEPDSDIAAVGSGGPFALAAARALLENTQLTAREVAERHEDRRRHLHLHQRSAGLRGAVMSPTHQTSGPVAHPAGHRRGAGPLHRRPAAAKRAVAVALRNRWRRQQVPPPMRDEIAPKNIMLIGPTGVGKTEIARRLAKLAGAPFVKVEASKFTEVGYVGRDVDSMVRDLAETAVSMLRDEERERLRRARQRRGAPAGRAAAAATPQSRPRP